MELLAKKHGDGISAAVIGCGPVGLMAILAAQAQGATQAGLPFSPAPLSAGPLSPFAPPASESSLASAQLTSAMTCLSSGKIHCPSAGCHAGRSLPISPSCSCSKLSTSVAVIRSQPLVRLLLLLPKQKLPDWQNRRSLLGAHEPRKEMIGGL